MSLDNLVKSGQIKPHKTSPAEIRKLLATAESNLLDARVDAIADTTRFDVAYKAIMQSALIALMASGYRPSTHAPGHHQTLIASLRLTMAVSQQDWLVLDALRKKRNIIDYEGELIDSASLNMCVARAEALVQSTRQWLEARYVHLIRTP